MSAARLLADYPALMNITIRPKPVRPPRFDTNVITVRMAAADIATLNALATHNKCKRAEMLRRIIQQALDGQPC